jgi:hypothetical protein
MRDEGSGFIGFLYDERTSYNRQAAQDWALMPAFLKNHTEEI